MWFIKIGLIIIAFLNVPALDLLPVETTRDVNVGQAPGGFDRYGGYATAPFPAPPAWESKALDPLTPPSPEASAVLAPEPGVSAPAPAPGGAPLLTDYNPHFQVPLYAIGKPGTAPAVYLLGSSHNVPLESYPDVVGQVAARADVLGSEILSEESLLSPSMAAFGLYKDSGFNWIARLSAENQLKMGYLSAEMDRYHPALVHFLFSRIGSAVFRQRDGINAQLQSAFAQEGKARFALETRQERVVMGTGIDPRVIMPSARVIPWSEEALNHLFTQFCLEIQPEGRLEDLQAYATMDQAASGDLHPVYHTARNERWLPRILDAIQHRFPGQTLLIDVGFLHLPGDRGLLSLLAQEDYTVTRVALPQP